MTDAPHMMPNFSQDAHFADEAVENVLGGNDDAALISRDIEGFVVLVIACPPDYMGCLRKRESVGDTLGFTSRFYSRR